MAEGNLSWRDEALGISEISFARWHWPYSQPWKEGGSPISNPRSGELLVWGICIRQACWWERIVQASVGQLGFFPGRACHALVLNCPEPLLMDSLESDQWLNWRRVLGASSSQTGQVCLSGSSVQSKAVSHWDTLLSPSSPWPSSLGKQPRGMPGKRKLTEQPEFRSRSRRAKEAADWTPFLLVPSPKVLPWHQWPLPLPERTHPSFTLQPSRPVFPDWVPWISHPGLSSITL